MKYQIADYSLQGARRINQDRIAYAERDNSVLIVLADGLGGHAGGELAAELFTQTVIHVFQSIRQPVITQPSAFLALSILRAHKAIVAMGQAQDPPIKPRTTCVLCLVQDGYAYWAHVGDSRLYLFRNGKMIKRTLDHTLTEQLRQEGVLSEDEMLDHPGKSRLLKCVGGPREPSIALGEETALMPDDTLLLCTDGLWEALTMEEIGKYLEAGNLEDVIVDLVLAAENKMQDSSDNISASCLRWEDGITRKPALQPDTVRDVDLETLWQGAGKRKAAAPASRAKKSTGRKEKKGGRAKQKKNDDTKSLEKEIKKLESYLDQFLPKR